MYGHLLKQSKYQKIFKKQVEFKDYCNLGENFRWSD